MIKRDSPTSVDCPIRYVFSFDTGEECQQTLDFSVVAFLKSRVLRDAGHLIGRQHDAKSQQHITGEGQKPQKQQAGLHESRQTQRCDLFHPLVETVLIAPRYTEHIQ